MAIKKIKRKIKMNSAKKLITNVDDVPVTHLEMKAVTKQISSLRISMDKKFESIDRRFESLEAKMDSRFIFMNSRFDQLSADIYRVLAIVEEQNARNKVVMDSQSLIQYKFEEHNTRIGSLEVKVNGIK